MPKTNRRPQASEAMPPAVPPPDLEAVIETDRAFFRNNPTRSYRMRPTELAEMEAFARKGSAIEPALPGFRWVTVVRQVVPGGRLRRVCQLPTGRDLDPPECVAEDLFRYIAGEPGTVLERIMREQSGAIH